MTIDEILDLMDELLDKSVAIPFSNKKCAVDIDKLREYIDEIRYNMPNEISNAKQMVYDRSQIINGAKKEAENIIKRAEERAKLMVNNEEIVKQAKEKANDIILNAQNKDKEIRIAMNERIEEMLSQAEEVMNKNLNEIRQIKNAIRETAKNK
jgi:vacuolar-type H+-ATPase subunit H